MEKDRNIILSLIKDDLTNMQLINGLNNIGLDAGRYYLHLTPIFFGMMGFGDYMQDDELYEDYFDFAEQATKRDFFENSELLNIRALEVYNKLLVEKQKRK